MRQAVKAIRESIVYFAVWQREWAGLQVRQEQCGMKMQQFIYKAREIQPRRRALLLVLAGLIHMVTLTERNRLDIVPSDDYAGTSAGMDLVLPKTENCIRSMRSFSMTDFSS